MISLAPFPPRLAHWLARLLGLTLAVACGSEFSGSPPNEPAAAAAYDLQRDLYAAADRMWAPSAGEDQEDWRTDPSTHAADVRLASGHVVHTLTFNGRSPGPELRVRRGR